MSQLNDFVEPELAPLLAICEQQHGHLCPGQVLGVRMALLGCRLINISDPRGAERKRLLVWVEIDRCLTDAISTVTGVRLGRRSLKFLDYGKVAATFLNTQTDHAVRIVALDSARELADVRHPELADKKSRQMRAYSEGLDEELFKVAKVSVSLTEFDLPGRPRTRVTCAECGEGVNDGREVSNSEGRPLCKPCADGNAYYNPFVVTQTARVR